MIKCDEKKLLEVNGKFFIMSSFLMFVMLILPVKATSSRSQMPGSTQNSEQVGNIRRPSSNTDLGLGNIEPELRVRDEIFNELEGDLNSIFSSIESSIASANIEASLKASKLEELIIRKVRITARVVKLVQEITRDKAITEAVCSDDNLTFPIGSDGLYLWAELSSDGEQLSEEEIRLSYTTSVVARKVFNFRVSCNNLLLKWYNQIFLDQLKNGITNNRSKLEAMRLSIRKRSSHLTERVLNIYKDLKAAAEYVSKEMLDINSSVLTSLVNDRYHELNDAVETYISDIRTAIEDGVSSARARDRELIKLEGISSSIQSCTQDVRNNVLRSLSELVTSFEGDYVDYRIPGCGSNKCRITNSLNTNQIQTTLEHLESANDQISVQYRKIKAHFIDSFSECYEKLFKSYIRRRASGNRVLVDKLNQMEYDKHETMIKLDYIWLKMTAASKYLIANQIPFSGGYTERLEEEI